MIVSDKGIEYTIYDKDGKVVREPPTFKGGLPDNENKYRYYHCVMGTFGDWTCEERNSLSSPGNEVSKCLLIYKSVPKILDPLILNYKNIPKTIVKK